MEDTKELAKATDLVEQNNEAFDNTFPWLAGEDSAKTLEEPMRSDSASCDEQDLITRISDGPIEGAELLSETKENWWVSTDDDGINWEWMFPTSTSKSDHPDSMVQVEEEPRIVYEFCAACGCTSPIDCANNKQEVSSIPCEPSKVEEPMPKVKDSLWENVDGVDWDWINPYYLNSDSDNDDSPVEDDAQPSHVTFDNCVAVVQGTFQELNSVSRGDIRSPSEITPIREADSWTTTSSLSDEEKLRTVRSISSSQGIPKVRKCPFLSALGKVSNNNASPNTPARPDLLTMLKDLAAKLRDLANDINVLVGRLAVESPSDDWIESMFSTRSVDGSFEGKSSLSSNASSVSKDHEENACSHDSWDEV